MIIQRIKPFVALALLFGAVACGGSPPPQEPAEPVAAPTDTAPKQTAAFAGRTFIMDKVTGYTQAKGSPIRIEFTDSRISFHAGCNNHSATYHVEGDSLVVPASPGFLSSLAACVPIFERQDAWLRDLLLSRPSYKLDGNTLTLVSGRTTATFVDQSVADPGRPLVGGLWIINTLIGGGAASSVGDVRPSIRFQADGRAALDTGCNTGTVPYEVSESRVNFGVAAMTRKICLPDQTKTESHILGVVSDGQATFRIDGSNLTIERPDGTAVKAGAE